MNKFFKSMVKKKRPVDPNAPPRPNLMSHDKVIREQKTTIEDLNQKVNFLTKRLAEVESRFNRQQLTIQSLTTAVNSLSNKFKK